MDIKDVKVGDRCWVSKIGNEDEYGQNATVASIVLAEITVRKPDGMLTYRTPGENAFWRKPEAPPKPRRKVTKTGWMNKYPWGYSMVYLDPVSAEDSADKLERLGCIQVSWEEIE